MDRQSFRGVNQHSQSLEAAPVRAHAWSSKDDYAPRHRYRFVITANGRMDNASATLTSRCRRGIGRHVNRSCPPLSESVSRNSIAVSFHSSPMGGKPTREDSRGAITTIHLFTSRRAKLTQQSANVQ